MKQSFRRRLPKIVVGTAVFLLVSLYSATSVPSVQDDSVPEPTSGEIQDLLDLSEWVLGIDGQRSLMDLDLAGAIRNSPRGFDLFRDLRDERQRKDRLRSLPFGGLILESAARNDVDGFLIAAVVEAESSFNPSAVSPAGAVGLMQVLPSTADFVRIGAKDPLEPKTNLEVGTRYLGWLLELYDGDLELALAAYNAGPGNVNRYSGIPPFPETERYVERVLTTYVDHYRSLWRGSEEGEWLFGLRRNGGANDGA